MKVLTVLSVFVFALSSHGKSCGLEAAYGLSNLEIENPDGTRAVSEGYGGILTLQHSFVGNENYSLGFRANFGYAEYENKANTPALWEETRHYTMGPGLEFNIYRIFLGADYNYNNMTVDMSGSVENKTHASFFAPQFFAGVDLPLGSWSLRFYYVRGQGDISRDDTSLINDSGVTRESFWIGLRFNTYLSGSGRVSYSEPEEGTDGSRLYRPTRYFSRPARSLGN